MYSQKQFDELWVESAKKRLSREDLQKENKMAISDRPMTEKEIRVSKKLKKSAQRIMAEDKTYTLYVLGSDEVVNKAIMKHDIVLSNDGTAIQDASGHWPIGIDLKTYRPTARYGSGKLYVAPRNRSYEYMVAPWCEESFADIVLSYDGRVIKNRWGLTYQQQFVDDAKQRLRGSKADEVEHLEDLKRSVKTMENAPLRRLEFATKGFMSFWKEQTDDALARLSGDLSYDNVAIVKEHLKDLSAAFEGFFSGEKKDD